MAEKTKINSIKILKDKRFYFLWISSVLGGMAVLPYACHQIGVMLTQAIILGALIQFTFLYAGLAFFGIKLSEKSNFKIISLEKYVFPSIISGLCLGLTIRLLDYFIFEHRAGLLIKLLPNPELWHKLLASFYGAINEEIFLRLFFVSLIVQIFKKIKKSIKKQHIIASIALSALLFSIGHLPMLYKMAGSPNTWDITRVIILNGISGIVFGLLYWRYGLISSMISHFIANLIIHVI